MCSKHPSSSGTVTADNRHGPRAARRGIATLWLILVLPAMLILLCLVMEIGNLWLARMELEDALEAAALAGVKEWGDIKGGDTLTSRNVAREFAEANTVRGVPVALAAALNYTNTNVNDNTSSSGELVFGSITQTSPTVIFNANTEPSCGVATILFDASAGNLQADDAWGVSFQDDLGAGLTITQVVINLGPGIQFDFTTGGGPVVSSNIAPHAVKDNSGNEQADNFGITAADITFSPTMGTSTSLTITFGVGTFAADERFRFGASVVKIGPGKATQNGDDIGATNSTVTVTFSNTSTQMATFNDNADFGSNDCPKHGDITTVPGRVIVHPAGGGTLDLPCPPTSAKNNNQQSFVRMVGGGAGAGTNAFAVRAQVTVPVPSLCDSIFGSSFGPFMVSADTTAMYDCMTECPQIIRVDTFLP